jgi:hypothetical protein
MKEHLETAISGSFKFKPEIDRLHEEFADYNVTVLEPTRGWLYVPSGLYEYPSGFRPLPVERGMTIMAIEERFMRAVRRSDFLYLYDPGGYVGVSAAMELGCAFAHNIPVFASEPIGFEYFDLDIAAYMYCNERITVASPHEAATIIRQQLEAKEAALQSA